MLDRQFEFEEGGVHLSGLRIPVIKGLPQSVSLVAGKEDGARSPFVPDSL